MPNKYSEKFNIVLKKYKQHGNRAGYTDGWFTSFRHSFDLYPHIQELQKNLLDCQTDADSKSILEAYFQDTKTKFKNHSFALYLLDELTTSYFDENWQRFYPPSKTLQFYQGTLYRGTVINSVQLNEIFKNGIKARENSNKVEDYASHTTNSIGISTSKDLNIATSYVGAFSGAPVSGGGGTYNIIPQFIRGYVIEVDYRELGGIDITATYAMRGGNWFHDSTVKAKQEVNIVTPIKPEDIVCAYTASNGRRTGQRIENPNYQPNLQRANQEGISQSARLGQLFSTS